MTTAQSPLHKLKAQADRIAAHLKAVERGDPVPDPTGKIAASRAGDSTTFAIAMDDKILTITMAWSTIRETSEAGIAEYILKHMRGAGDAVN